MGISVLSCRGWVGNTKNPSIDLRLDSGADITLISEEYYRSLISPPAMQQGLKMKLWQLMDKHASLKGFVRMPIFIMDGNGELIETEAEAYIVPGMTVPILLGEDYHLTYDINIARNTENGTSIHFAGTKYSIWVTNAEKTADFNKLRPSAYLSAHFVKAKIHRRNQAKRRK
ncbi:hypothetical protein Hypma_006020 [Hypsizygus marmoreus]|uniref:Peptidase A2 domain-containing protein n=1 Tax=Hypsizygus marmoreus TaxID=39966 RepID=A0A369JYZ8_HYPMA|nr:hypothetical protein Hypma_006020 [Hypsizygus marmoreus]